MGLTKEQLEKARAILEEDRQRKLSLARDYDYDGVLGWPPSWVPEPFLFRFRDYRDWFLDSCGFEHTEVLRFLQSFETDEDEIIIRHRGRKGAPFSTHEWLEKLGYLAHLKWCASLGPKEGLEKLAGKDTALGFSRRNDLDNFAKRRGKEQHETRSREWDKWNAEAKRLLNANSYLSRNKAELARKVVRNLGLTEKPDTVARRIKLK